MRQGAREGGGGSDTTLVWQLCKQPPSYFCVYFEGSLPAEEPRGVMPGELPQFYLVPWILFYFIYLFIFYTKRERK
jgi:hypothetical protein